MSKKRWITVAVVAVAALVAGVVTLFIVNSGDTDSVARFQQLPTNTVATTPTTSAASGTTQVPSQSRVVAPSTSTSVDMIPHLQPGQELTPTPIGGLNFPIDSKTWSVYGPFDGAHNRMTKVNLTEIGGKPACEREVAMVNTRVCPGFVVVDADQSPFYTEEGCLTIGWPHDPTYKFSKRLDDVRINDMVVERIQMVRCEAPGVSFVWQFPLKDGTKVHVIEIGNDSTTNPLPGLVELLDKVTAVG